MSTRQHSIDLMPVGLRARSQAGLRMGQFVVFVISTMTLTIIAATHSKLALSTAQERLFESAIEAEQVFATEARAAELRHDLEAIQAYARQYEQLAFPLEVNDILATLVHLLPDSVTLDQINLDVGARVIARSARSRTSTIDPSAAPQPRVLAGELSGFAPDDRTVAEMVSRLEASEPFESVSLDFSRGRVVRARDAREFRLSFRIDLERRYVIIAGESEKADPRERAPSENLESSANSEGAGNA